MPQIEAIPNISEGRRASVLASAATAVGSRTAVSLLDVSADPSHNRAVLTIVGDADPLVSALCDLFAVAIEGIDLRHHQGVHPRFGAVDVVPFVPLRHASMTECVQLARRLGQQVADQFGIPVYLYGEAATSDQRRALEDVRRGQFEGLAVKMREAAWRPDYGPPAPHPTAGATAIGARQALVAFNVNLRTTNVEIARQIASLVRERDGGLPGIKAMGVPLAHRQLVQVSMNVTDLDQTPLHRVFAQVERAAARRGVEIADGEIVGLAPTEALVPVTAHALRLARFTPDRVLETRMADAARHVPRPPDAGT